MTLNTVIIFYPGTVDTANVYHRVITNRDYTILVVSEESATLLSLLHSPDTIVGTLTLERYNEITHR